MTLDDLIEYASQIYGDAREGTDLHNFAGKVLDYTESVTDLEDEDTVDRQAVKDAMRDILEGDGYRRALGRDRLRALGVLP